MPQTLPTAVGENLEFEDFYESTLNLPLNAADTDIYPVTMPISVESFLVIDPEGSNPEVIFYNDTGADYVRCPSATDGEGRGVFNTSPQDWDAGTKIGMYSTAAFFEAIVTGRAMRSSFFAPTGSLLPYAGPTAPDGWLLCNGASLLRASYPDLFDIIGTAYGSADGTHFTLPDMRGRMPFGSGARTWAVTVANTDVDAGTDQIAITANDNVKTGKAVVLTTSGGAPGGLTAATTYYVIVVDSTHIKLATSQVNASKGTAINITSQGTGSHTLTFTGTSRSVGATGGEDSHNLVNAELPTEGSISSPNGPIYTDYIGAGAQRAAQVNVAAGANQIYINGSSTPVNVLNPYVAMNYIIKT